MGRGVAAAWITKTRFMLRRIQKIALLVYNATL